MPKIRVAIHGAAGRMGRRLVALGCADPEVDVVAAIDSPAHPDINQDAGGLAGLGPIGVPLSSHLNTGVDVVIDFSVPEAALHMAALCAERNIPLVVATTGFTHEDKERLASIAQKIPLVWSPSMSMAVNLTMKMAALAGQVLRDYPHGTDVEIIERHHRFKEDAPSGTALRFGEIVSSVMGQSQHVHGRSGRPGHRHTHEIGYHALRTGDNPGEHTIVFGMLGETIELTVKASNRDCYALGAIAAAKFVAGKPKGLYSMADVLGL
jgi:4-hydroxy-tetrahydrodipicolinate reductase